MASPQAQTYQATMDARFRIAARHSRRVRLLRIAVPAVVTVAMLVIVGASVFNPFRILSNLPLKMDNLVVSGTRVTMEKPVLAGFMPDQRPYELRAKTAVQDIRDPKYVELDQLDSNLVTEDKGFVRLQSRTGLFDTKEQLLDLRGDVYVTRSDGLEARMDKAFVDLGKGTVTSDTHVNVKMTNGTVDSDRLRITERGNLMRFEGNVVMHLDGKEGGFMGAAPTAQAGPNR